MKRVIKLFICVLLVLTAPRDLSAQDSVQTVIDWLRIHANNIKSIDDGHDFEDLVPLEKKIGNVQAIGLGEGTHGTFEFYRMKKRLIQFLVTRMHFKALVLEASYASCQPINDYLLYGEGDVASVLTGQGYTPWDNEEFLSVLQWLRNYNKMVTGPQKVRFYGMDLCYNGGGRRYVQSFLKSYAKEKVDSADSLFEVLRNEEANWPTRIDQNKLQKSYVPLQNLITYFDKDEKKLTARSGWSKWDSANQYLKVMKYWLLANLADSLKPAVERKMGRSAYMAENLSYIVEREQPGTRFMIWAHNGHILSDTSDPNFGAQLRKNMVVNFMDLGYTVMKVHSRQGNSWKMVIGED